MPATQPSPPAENLRQQLAASGPPWPGPIEHRPSVTSTNDLLREQARSGAAAWSVLLADQQTAGHGRQGHVWLSPGGNLYLSVLLRPTWEPAKGLVLPLATGVAVADALLAEGVKAKLKWPNDVLVEGRKIAGVLVEASVTQAGLEWAVVGIGLNLALDRATLPPELQDTVTSLSALGGSPDRIEWAARILHRLAAGYRVLDLEGAPAVIAAWRARALPWWGRMIEARTSDGIVQGIAAGLDERGALLLDLSDGSRLALLSAEVREVRATPGAGAR